MKLDDWIDKQLDTSEPTSIWKLADGIYFVREMTHNPDGNVTVEERIEFKAIHESLGLEMQINTPEHLPLYSHMLRDNALKSIQQQFEEDAELAAKIKTLIEGLS